jgi:hypothetical protein
MTCDELKNRGLGAAVGPQRGPGAEPLVGVKGVINQGSLSS